MKSTILQLPVKLLATFEKAPRVEIQCAYVDAAERVVVATNGRTLVTIPIPGTATIRPGFLTVDLWKAAKAMARKGPIILDYAAGTIATLPYPEEHPEGYQYPDWKAVVPEIKDPAYRLKLDPHLLSDVAAALATEKTPGLTLEMSGTFTDPIVLTGAHGSGVIMPITHPQNPEGHGLRAAPAASTTPDSSGHSEATPERSPTSSLITAHCSPITPPPFKIDRSEMLRDPIAWLRRLDVELRHLTDFTPHGGYIFDYLTVGQIAREAENLEAERDEAIASEAATEENLEGEIDDLKKLLKRIIAVMEEADLTSISNAADALKAIADSIYRADIAEPFNDSAFDEELEKLREIATPKSDADFESMKAERDAIAVKLTHANNRITALEIAAKHRQAIQDHSTNQKSTIKNQQSAIAPAPTPTPEHSPTSSTDHCSLLTDHPPILTRNEPKNGIELRFDGKPADEVREAMKTHGFRWCPRQPDQPWVARYTEERWVFATALAEGRKGTRLNPDSPAEITGIEDAAPPALPERSPAIPSAFADF